MRQSGGRKWPPDFARVARTCPRKRSASQCGLCYRRLLIIVPPLDAGVDIATRCPNVMSLSHKSSQESW